MLSALTVPHPPAAQDAALLRRAFERADYGPERIQAVLMAAAQSATGSPLETLVRLFFLNAPVSREQADDVLGEAEVEAALRIGLVTAGDDVLRAVLQIDSEAGLLLAADWDHAVPGATAPFDHVMSPAKSTRRLAALTVRRPVELALDLGTGCGYQALLAARHARHVVAIDTNPRALALASFNAALNDAGNIEFLQSDWFGALGGREFDLIVCNPPYVIAPEQRLLYRDDASGELGETLVRTAAAFLRDGGLAHIVVGWTHRANQHWAEPLQGWVTTTGCDAWLFRQTSVDPATHAALWNADLVDQPNEYATAIERWTDHLARRGIEMIGDGAVVLRKRSGTPQVSFDNLPSSDLGADAAEDLARRMIMVDRLGATSDETLLSSRVELVPTHRLEQTLHHAVSADGFIADRSTLFLDGGLGSSLLCNPQFVQLLSRLDGKRELCDVVAGGNERFQAGALSSIRYALLHGFLRFAS